MEIVLKIGDARYPDNPVYLKNWLNGQPIEARWDGFPWQKMDRRHFAIIRTPDDFWQVRGGTDWKVWNKQAEEFKKLFSATDSQGKYRWEFGFLEVRKRRDWFLNYDELILQKLITQGEYDTWKDHDTESPIININRSFFDIIKNEYESRLLPTELKNQGITSGTYQIGTGGGADYATWALFATAVNAGNQMDGNLTGEGQDEETAIATVVEVDTDTNGFLLKLTAESGAEHSGTFGNAIHQVGDGARVNMASGDYFELDETTNGHLDDAEISNLVLDVQGSNTGVTVTDGGNSGQLRVNRCVIKGDSNSRRGIQIFSTTTDNVLITNNIIYDIGNGAGEGGILNSAVASDAQVIEVYNNTCINNYENFVQDDNAPSADAYIYKNNLAQAGQNADWRDDGSGFGTHSKNISEDGTSPDAAYRNMNCHDGNSCFINYGADDYRLVDTGDEIGLTP